MNIEIKKHTRTTFGTLTFRCEKSEIQRLKDICNSQGHVQADVLRTALTTVLDNLDSATSNKAEK